jgi:hypothetical protein
MENRGISSGDILASKIDVATKSVKYDSYETFTCWCAQLYDMFFLNIFGEMSGHYSTPSQSHLVIVMVKLVKVQLFAQACKYIILQ